MAVRVWMLASCALVLSLEATGCGCGSNDGDHTPAAVLSRFIEAMDRSSGNDDALEDAYALLDSDARRTLSERAKQAALVAGRDFQPWQMLAQGRFRLRFAPAEHGGMQASVNGDHAVVRVKSSDGTVRAEVPMVREADSWRVQLEVPALRRDGPAPAPAASQVPGGNPPQP